MTGPQFIIVGAMKCGTSTLAAQLGAQQGLFMTTPKEPNYFSDDAIFAKGPEWYASLFDAANPQDIRGEASTHYTKRPNYPETLPRMLAAVPDVKLVYMIRNPMVRLVSHYIHAWSEAETADPIDLALTSNPDLVNFGRYGWQIDPFVQQYGTDAILLTSLERLKAQPDEELNRIARHLGHTDPVSWNNDLQTQNVSSERMRKFPLQGLLLDNPVARVLRRTLVPKSVRTRIRSTRQVTERPQISDAMKPQIEDRFAQDREHLNGFFPNDPSLDLAYPFLDPLSR